MVTIHIDESGYTGVDLLNRDQPFQGASSLRIDEESAKSLVDRFFPRRKSIELKHKKLSKRKSNWDKLLEIQKVVLEEFMGFTYVCNKKYLLILRFLDTCIEPFFYDRGMDFFENGQNYALASLMYYTASTFWGEEELENLLYLYQRASKTKLDVNVQALIEKAKSLKGRKLSENLIPLIIEDRSCIRELKHSHTNTDAALIVLLSLINHIEKHLDQEYTIVHDKSKNLLTYNSFLNKFINIEDEVSFKLTAETQLNFPLKLVSVEQVDSKSSYGIQIADLLVGGMIEHCMALYGLVKKNEYNQSVLGLYSDTNLLHMLPSLDFEESKNYREGSESFKAIDFIASKFS